MFCQIVSETIILTSVSCHRYFVVQKPALKTNVDTNSSILHQVFRLEATLVNKPWAQSGFDFHAIFYVLVILLERKHLRISNTS